MISLNFQNNFKKLIRFFSSGLFVNLALIGNAFLVLTTVLFYYFEKEANPEVNSYFDSFWWGVTTITTVGFGDVVPETTAGRVIGILLMYSGTVLFIAFVGFLVNYWIGLKVDQEIIPLEEEIADDEALQWQILKNLKDIRKRIEILEKGTLKNKKGLK